MNRYIHTLAIMLAVWLTAGNAMAQEQESGEQQGQGSGSSSTGVVVRGNVYGGGNLADVKTNTEVNMSTGIVEGNVYGGGNLGDVGTHADQDPVSVGNYDWKDQDGNTITNTTAAAKMTGVSKVTITGGTVGVENSAKPKEQGNVFGGGKGAATTFECEKGMVYKTSVSIQKNGTTNTLVYRNVYGGGEVSRVENDTEVTIGTASGTDEPNIKGSVFAAGAGVETHGYSALVRGHSTVTVQGKATVEHNVYGGGELASVGRYKVKTPANASDTDVPATLPYGMPAHLIDGGKNTVTITDNAVIGTEGDNTTGHVYGAGKGLDPYETTYTYEDDANKPKRMVSGNTWEHFAKVAAYLQFVETLALSAATDVDISGSATVKGSVFGGSESGFVYHDTDVAISGGTINGDAFGGGRGLSTFAEAGRVRGNTNLAVSGGAVEGNVYGGGNLGDVGTINKSDASYNYVWKNSAANGNVEDEDNDNTSGNNMITGTNTNTGICTVTISGGTIGVDTPDDATRHGNVFGAGEGLDDTWWCEKATAFATHVTITDGTVKGNVYGGGQIGRVEDDAKVTIGNASDTGSESKPNITGSVFGAGAGLATHGYSALVRGNTEVTVEGIAQVGGNVYGGGEKASVGRFHVVGGLPKNPQAGGICTVKIQGSAKVGTSGTDHNVFGACKGVTPEYVASGDNRSKSMQLYKNRPSDTSLWSHYNNDENSPFIWRYYASEADYLDFLQTLALTSNTDVTIAESASVYGSVFGGGERGVTLGGVDVNMVGGTVKKDVYGGGSLADSNRAMRDNDDALHDYVELELIEGLSVVTGYYTSKSDDALITTADAKAVSGTTYYAKYKTNVNLTGGVVEGDAYGGGLGIHDIGEVGQTGYVAGTPAYVYGNVTVKLNESVENDAKGCVVSRVFGCNNLKGTPKGHVLVHVYATQNANKEDISSKNDLHGGAETGATSTYDVAAVYGGGNLAPYEPAGSTATRESTEVIIDGCQLTSIKQVYGGGNAAPAPATLVRVNGTYEIEEVFGGGNGKDDYVVNNKYYKNPGANVGYYNYTHLDGSGEGTSASPYTCADNEDADTKEERTAADSPYVYGTGVATIEIVGGKIHYVYGGSNEKGNIRTTAVSTYEELDEDCPIDTDETYGGGKNSIIDGVIDMGLGCIQNMAETFGGSKNADVNSDIVLNITNGTYGRVFGGNNTSGNINGSITVNIYENGCSPIRIGELYAGGYLAGYSIYGYKDNGEVRTKAEYDDLTEAQKEEIVVRQDPRINVISATRIDNIFGGGYQAVVVGSPHVNVNMENGRIAQKYIAGYEDTEENPFVGVHYDSQNRPYYDYEVLRVEQLPDPDNPEETIQGDAILAIGTIGNIYGGGNEADIIGDTYVEIGTGTYYNSSGELETISPARKAATITGNVYGGGKGVAKESGDGAFQCATAMVGVADQDFGSTNVTIYNGTVEGNVYGGGQIGRVEKNTTVTIGKENDTTNEPVVEGNVFGAGRGVNTHGYAALVRGKTLVTVQGKAKVKSSVYGGGEIASVGRYKVKLAAGNPTDAPDWVPIGMPYSLYNPNSESGNCTVIIRGDAEIGPDTPMTMKADGGPDDKGHVFGAGQGVLPYEGYAANETPWRMPPSDIKQEYDREDEDDKEEYLTYIETLALATQTEVTISGNALVKGSVYGGSMNGHVQHDTHVTIEGGQIGCQKGTAVRLNPSVWGDNYSGTDDLECDSWDFSGDHLPYDIYKDTDNDGTPDYATDGHTFYGNVFGGGSGYYPYMQNPDFTPAMASSGYVDGLWHRAAGSVGGNTRVDITGGHILTSVYGGNEQTDVGTYTADANGALTVPVENTGKCVINMVGGTIGVPRTEAQAKAHPVTCYVFGAGKGDQRINFNTWTNVASTEVNISGNARIYGSTFGGGEDGHVIGDVVTNIGGTVTIGSTSTSHSDVIIGTTGTSSVDGNIFGGGRGFSETALAAGAVGGNVTVNIQNGKMLGSIFGGGRLASVGTYFADVESSNYGKMQVDSESETHGHIAINISGGTIGATDSSGKLMESASSIGDVFGGCKGSATNDQFGLAKKTSISVTGGTVNGSVYGGGEAGNVTQDVDVAIAGGSIGGDVYGGGALANTNIANWDGTNNKWAAGNYDATTYATAYNTDVVLTSGVINGNVYGGGLGRQAKEAVAAQPAVAAQGTEGEPDYVPAQPAVEAQPAVAAVEAKVYGDVLVKLNKTTESDNCVVKGNIFGCNNQNGSPQSAVTVHIYKTQEWDGHTGTASGDLANEDATHTYHLAAVYGGGNLSAFKPDLESVRDTVQTHVIIDGCDMTSIQHVYGGGNAASTPATNIIVNGTYEIEEVFGGGNGKDAITVNGVTQTNPGANVGYVAYSTEYDPPASSKEERTSKFAYGTGKASVTILGGRIHRVFGGSNTKGNVRESAVTMLQDMEGCDFVIDEAYGGGKSAPMDADAQLLMACIPGLKAAYGGAEDADIAGGVTLTITNGTFDRVFGGNNKSGSISGPIVVNIEEMGCRPIIIGELYGGGNQAGYSVYGYDNRKPRESGTNPLWADPVVNVKSFTSIGDIYGGGYGETAVMVASPTVNINVAEGRWADDDQSVYSGEMKTIDGHRVTLPPHEKGEGKIGVIQNVYGGGNAAKVIGTPNVNIGTRLGEDEYMAVIVEEGKTLTDCYTFTKASGTAVAGTTYYQKDDGGAYRQVTVGEGASVEDYYIRVEFSGTPVAGTTYYKKYTVKGADIRGNVYGGGNAAEVTGNTNVVIGKETATP